MRACIVGFGEGKEEESQALFVSSPSSLFAHHFTRLPALAERSYSLYCVSVDPGFHFLSPCVGEACVRRVGRSPLLLLSQSTHRTHARIHYTTWALVANANAPRLGLPHHEVNQLRGPVPQQQQRLVLRPR